MRKSLTILLAGLGLLLALFLAQWDSSPKGSGGRIWVGQGVIERKTLRSEPLPVPPQISRDGSQGLTVCSLFIDKEGNVTDVAVIQAPHAALAETLPAALRAWKFSKTTVGGNPVELTGKVIRYLVNDDGVGRFLTPGEMIERVQAAPAEVRDSEKPQRVDVRDRAEFERQPAADAVNIPLDELQVRAPVELAAGQPVAIDCSRLSYDRCKAAAAYLHGEGFSQVTIVGEGVSCPRCP